MTLIDPSKRHDKIILRVSDVVTYVEGRLNKEIYQGLKKALGYQDDKAMWKSPRGKGGKPNTKWDGWQTTVCYNKKYCKCPVKKDGTHFPTGLLSRARDFFNLENVPYQLIDARVEVSKDSNYSMSPEFELRDYQLDIIKKAVKQQRGIIKVATGGGKTATASGIIAELGVKPFIFYVTSIDLLKQAKSELEKFIRYEGKPIEVGTIGGGKCEIRDINVMTIQTAVRSLGEKFKKHDDEDGSDNAKYDETDKERIANLIRTCQGMICDETQHWASRTAQIIADHSLSARYKYGLSATPWRDEGDDILIDACFGKPIVDINASFLIDKGILVQPTIYFVHMPRLDIEGAYQTVYKEGIVENIERNTMIANLADQMTKNGRQTLILVKHIEHGNTLESMIPDSFFINGSHSGKQREKWIQKMRDQEAKVTIATSLPYEEMIVIKHNGLIKHVEIGYLCENMAQEVKNQEIESMCSSDGKTIDWKLVTNTHRHLRKTDIVQVQTNRKEEILVTEDHPLVDTDMVSSVPQVGKGASCPKIDSKNANYSKQTQINVLDILPNDDSIEVEITGLNHSRIRMLNSERKYIENSQSVSKSTRYRVSKKIEQMPDNYAEAVIELVDNFKYYKGKYRCSLAKARKLKTIYSFFDAKIFVRRSRSKFNLPIFLPISKDFSTLCGLLCSEGHINMADCKTCKSRYDVIFTGLKDVSQSSEGIHDNCKKEIREIFKDCNNKSIRSPVIENSKQIKMNGKLLFYLFSALGIVDSKGNKRVPDFIFNSHSDIQEAFLYGFYLGDGSRKLDYRPSKKQSDIFTAISLCNSSRPMISGIIILLTLMDKKFYLHSQEGKDNQRKRYIVNVVDPIGPLIPTRSRDRIDFSDPSRVQESVIKHGSQDEYVYDITVADCHNFIAGFGVLAHNCIFDEGVDVKPLDGLILAGSGKSQTRALQRIGRVIRSYKDPVTGIAKKDAFVVDFVDNTRYLRSHSDKRRNIYSTESKFIIKDFK